MFVQVDTVYEQVTSVNGELSKTPEASHIHEPATHGVVKRVVFREDEVWRQE